MFPIASNCFIHFGNHLEICRLVLLIFYVFVGRFCVLDARAVLGYLYMGGVGAASRPLGQVSLLGFGLW